MIAFAKQEAPGTVGFLEFLQGFLEFAPGAGGDTGESAAGGDLETCADTIAWAEDLMDTYDSFSEVPASELLVFANIGNTMATCSPEESAFFTSDEFSAFFDE